MGRKGLFIWSCGDSNLEGFGEQLVPMFLKGIWDTEVLPLLALAGSGGHSAKDLGWAQSSPFPFGFEWNQGRPEKDGSGYLTQKV